MAYGSNAFNALVPLYANVDRTPEYLSNTTAKVTTESFYWANRIIAALADPHFNSCAVHIERYQEAVGAKGHAAVNATDDDMVARDLSYGDATAALTKENDAIAAMLRDETDKVLSEVLYTASEGMRNAFARSDG